MKHHDPTPIATGVRQIAWTAVLIVAVGAIGSLCRCEARAEDLQRGDAREVRNVGSSVGGTRDRGGDAGVPGREVDDSQPREGQGERDDVRGLDHIRRLRRRVADGAVVPLADGASAEGWVASAAESEADERLARARLWLGRSLVAEAGWTATQTEYVALAWVLAKRARSAGRSLYRTVRTYCAGLGRHAHTARQQWVRELPADGQTRPEHWPDSASWEKHAPRWRRVLKLVDEWAAGEHPDPCTRARHFGGPMDAPQGRMRVVCAWLPIANRLYEVM